MRQIVPRILESHIHECISSFSEKLLEGQREAFCIFDARRQYSCLDNPRDRGAWWAAIYGGAQSRTRLKRLSSSSRRKFTTMTSLGSSLGWDTKLPHYLLKYYAFLELCTEIRIKVRKTCGVESMFLPRKYWRAEQSVFCRSLFTFKQNNMLSSRLK